MTEAALKETIRLVRTYAPGTEAYGKLQAFWLSLNQHLSRKQGPEAEFGDAVALFEGGESAEGAAEWLESQRWLARTEAA